MSNLPLQGIKAVEIADGVAGPYCGRLLAALGAEVVKIEIPPHGDSSRNTSPFIKNARGEKQSTLFLHNNTGKQSVSLDWTKNEEFQKLDSILSNADILIEDWHLSTRNKFDIDKDFFTSKFPSLIEINITPFGLTGPYCNWKSAPIVMFGLGGIMNIIGSPDKEPLMIYGHQTDYLTGMNACNALLISLWDRDHTNEGTFLELSSFETMANLHQAPLDMDGGIRKRRNHRQSSLSARGFPPGVSALATKDGYITYGGGAQSIWEQICLMIGRTDLYEGKDYEDITSDENLEDLVEELMQKWMSEKTRAEVFKEASEDWLLPVGPILSVKEILDDPQFTHRKVFQTVEHPNGFTAKFPAPPPIVNGERLTLGMAPSLGEHNKHYL